MSVTHIWLASDGSDSFYDATDYESLIDERMRHEGYAPPVDGRRRVNRRREIIMSGAAKEAGWTPKNVDRYINSSLKIPEALHPINFNECCVPAIKADIEQPNDMECFGTCYNERACHDSTYPYSSLEEKNKYGHLSKIVGDERQLLRKRCVHSPEWLVPNVTWCSKANSDENLETNDTKSVYGDIPKPGCSLITNGGGSGPWQHVFIFPKAKVCNCAPVLLIIECAIHYSWHLT
jgi:hypothetical protein